MKRVADGVVFPQGKSICTIMRILFVLQGFRIVEGIFA